MKVSPKVLIVMAISTLSCSVGAFSSKTLPSRSFKLAHTSASALAAKGFGAPKQAKKQKSEGQKKREEESSRYDDIAATGGQEYSIFVRQFGSDDQSWLPCGSIAVPRNAQVADAVFANESGLKASIVRTFPKLRGYENEFEFGFNLKVYPDDPIEVAAKPSATKTSGPSVGNWISNLLSPVDASQAIPPKN